MIQKLALLICCLLTIPHNTALAEDDLSALRTRVYKKTELHYSIKSKGFVTQHKTLTLTYFNAGKKVAPRSLLSGFFPMGVAFAFVHPMDLNFQDAKGKDTAKQAMLKLHSKLFVKSGDTYSAGPYPTTYSAKFTARGWEYHFKSIKKNNSFYLIDPKTKK